MIHKVFVVDSDASFVNNLVNKINKNKNYEVVGIAKDGLEAIEKLKSLKEEVKFLVINLILPQYDGFETLKRIKEDKSIHVDFIIALSFYSNMAIRDAIDVYHIDDFIQKPCSCDSLMNHMEQLLTFRAIEKSKESVLKESSIYKKITMLLHSVGIPAHIKGHAYLRQAILLCYENNSEYIGSVTKVLYPEIANIFHTSGSRVERAIRHAIEVAWTRGDTDTINRIFGYSVSRFKDKPTNSEFIALITDYIIIEENIKKNNSANVGA